MGILWYIFQDGDNSINNIIHFHKGKDILELIVGYTPDFWFNVIQIFGIVGQEHFELLFPHGFPQFLYLRNKLISNPP